MSAVAWMIVACEILFWVFILAGLTARYLLRREKAGLILLSLSPLVDLCLLIAASVDLARGGTATTAHALAAVYLGVSIGFGKSLIRWADEHFRYYVSKQGPKPQRLYGKMHAQNYLKGWFRHLLAYVIGMALLYAMIFFINDAARSEALHGVKNIWGMVLMIDLVITCSFFIWPKKAKE